MVWLADLRALPAGPGAAQVAADGTVVSDLLTAPGLPVGVMMLAMFLLMAVPMGPAEPTAVAAGLLAGGAIVPLWVVVPVLAAGMVAGDLLAFTAGGALHRRIRRRPGGAQWLDRCRDRLHAHPLWRDAAVLGLRFVPGARTPAALTARGSGIRTRRFCLLAVAGSLLWAGAWAGLASALSAVPGGVGVCAVVAGVAVVAVVLLIRRSCLRRARLR